MNYFMRIYYTTTYKVNAVGLESWKGWFIKIIIGTKYYNDILDRLYQSPEG